MRNRYYDSARLYAPSSYQIPNERSEANNRNVQQHIQEKQQEANAIGPVQSTKLNEKNQNENRVLSDAVMNETNHEKVYLIDDSSNNVNDDDDDSQIKYIYSLYKNRLSNNF